MRYQIAAHEKTYYEDHFLEVAQDFLHLELSIVDAYKIELDDKQKNCIRTTETYQIQGDIASHPDAVLSFTSSAHADFLMPKRNTHPVATTETGRTCHTVNIHYGNSPSSVNDEFELKNDWFSYKDTLKNRGTSIVCTTEFAGHTNSIEAKNVAACRDAVAELQKRSRTNVPLKLDLEVDTQVADHQWYLYPVFFLVILQATQALGLLGNPVVLTGLAIMPIAYLAYLAHRRKWFSFGK